MGKGPDSDYTLASLPTQSHTKYLSIAGKFLLSFTFNTYIPLIIYNLFFSSIILYFLRGTFPVLPDEGQSH